MAKKKDKWRWGEYDQWKKQQEGEAEPDKPVRRSGQCEECGHGSFQLKVRAGQMDRICKGCGVIKENV
jgi:hypothetical protein